MCLFAFEIKWSYNVLLQIVPLLNLVKVEVYVQNVLSCLRAVQCRCCSALAVTDVVLGHLGLLENTQVN